MNLLPLCLNVKNLHILNNYLGILGAIFINFNLFYKCFSKAPMHKTIISILSVILTDHRYFQ